MPGVGVAPFGLLGKHFPGDGDRNIIDDDPDGEDVNVAFPELPIGAIHGESPAFGGLGYLPQYETPEGDQGDGSFEEKILEPAVTTFVLGSA